jgi:hypothetical protein
MPAEPGGVLIHPISMAGVAGLQDTDNATASHLYKSLGFEREDIKWGALFRGGVFVDLLMMGRIRELP